MMSMDIILKMDSIIKNDNTIALIAITFLWAAFSIYAEQKWKWAAKITGTVICMLGAMVFSNANVIPSDALWFNETIWDFVIPLSIPLLLFQCNIKKIWKESGRLLTLFLIGSFGTAVSAVLAYWLLSEKIPHLEKIAAMMTGSYIGGSVNFASLSSFFQTPSEISAAATVADNFLMAVYFFVLIAISSSKFFQAHFKHPHILKAARIKPSLQTQSAAYWSAKKISLKDIAFDFAFSAAIVWISTEGATVLAQIIPRTNVAMDILNSLFSNRYLLMTTITTLLATFLPQKWKPNAGTQELGTYMIYLFFFAVGVPATLSDIIRQAPFLFLFCAIIVFSNMIFCFIGGKVLDFTLEDIILASNANIGGPTTAAAMAISKGWTDLTGAVLLVGTLGYAIGTYFGIFVGKILGA